MEVMKKIPNFSSTSRNLCLLGLKNKDRGCDYNHLLSKYQFFKTNRELLERSAYEVHLMAYPGYKLKHFICAFASENQFKSLIKVIDQPFSSMNNCIMNCRLGANV